MLTEEQERAVRHTYGPALVSAGPGSGTTRVLTERTAELCQICDPAKICVITFTQAAAKEMRERFTKIAGEKPVTFGTFHAVFLHWLMLWQYLPPDIHIRTDEPDETKGRDQEEVPALFLGQGDARYDLTFDEIIYLTYRAVVRDGYRMDYQFYLIDEFQDIDPIQYEIVRYLTGPYGNLFAVGDEDQAIYGFRGASPHIMLQFLKDYPTAVHLYLSANFRCSPPILEASVRLIRNNRIRFDKQLRSVAKGHHPVRAQAYPDTLSELRAVAKGIRRRHLLQGIPYEKMAVLTRTGVEADMVQEAFLEAGIPIIGKQEIAFIHKDFLLLEREKTVLEQAAKDRTDSNNRRILTAYYPLLADEGRPDLMSSERIDLEQTVRTLERLGEESSALGVLDLWWHTAFGERMKEKRKKQGLPRGIFLLQFLRMLTPPAKKGVTVSTMHGAKGLEFDAVWLVGLNEGGMPRKEAVTEEALEEERRVMYVALTRAKKNLSLSYTEEKPPSRYLTEMGLR